MDRENYTNTVSHTHTQHCSHASDVYQHHLSVHYWTNVSAIILQHFSIVVQRTVRQYSATVVRCLRVFLPAIQNLRDHLNLAKPAFDFLHSTVWLGIHVIVFLPPFVIPSTIFPRFSVQYAVIILVFSPCFWSVSYFMKHILTKTSPYLSSGRFLFMPLFYPVQYPYDGDKWCIHFIFNKKFTYTL